MSNFGVRCVAKNKKPACDEQSGSNSTFSTELIQAAMFANNEDNSPINVTGLGGVPQEIGSDSGATTNLPLIINLPTTGVTLVPTLNANNHIPRRIFPAVAGIYHYDIDIVFQLTAQTLVDVEVLVGPTVGTINDAAPTFLTTLQFSNGLDDYGSATDSLERQIHVSGNLNLSATDAVGIFWQVIFGQTPVTTTFSLLEARLRLFRLGENTV